MQKGLRSNVMEVIVYSIWIMSAPEEPLNGFEVEPSLPKIEKVIYLYAFKHIGPLKSTFKVRILYLLLLT